MKKSFMYAICIIVILFITGCGVNKQTEDVLFRSLQNEGIIDKDLILVETFTSKSVGVFIISNTYYIYKDKNNGYLGIEYSSCIGDYSCDADYKVSIYNVEATDEELVYISEDDIGSKERYFVINGKYVEDVNYDLTLKKEYQATEYKPLFGKKYYKFK